MEPIRPAASVEGRKPKTHTDRHCVTPDCSVRLSRYNPGPNCYRHSPIKYPRVRGKPSG